MSNVSLYSFQSDTELENLTSLTVHLVDSLNDSDWLLMQDMKVAWMDQPSLLLESNTTAGGDCSSVDLILTDDPLSPQSDIGGSQNTLFYVADYNISRSEDDGGCDGISDDGAGNNLRSFMCRLPHSSNEATNATDAAESDPNLKMKFEDWLDYCEQLKSQYGSILIQECLLIQRLQINSNASLKNQPEYGDVLSERTKDGKVSTEYLIGWITVAQCDTWYQSADNHIQIPFDSINTDTLWNGIWNYGVSVKIRGVSSSDLSTGSMDSSESSSLSFCGGYDNNEPSNKIFSDGRARNLGIMARPYSWLIDNMKRGFVLSHQFDYLEYQENSGRYVFNETSVRGVSDAMLSSDTVKNTRDMSEQVWIGDQDFISENMQSNADCIISNSDPSSSSPSSSRMTVGSLTRWKNGGFFVGTFGNRNVPMNSSLSSSEMCTDKVDSTNNTGGLLFTPQRCQWSAANPGKSGFNSKMPQYMQIQIGIRIDKESFENAVNLTKQADDNGDSSQNDTNLNSCSFRKPSLSGSSSSSWLNINDTDEYDYYYYSTDCELVQRSNENNNGDDNTEEKDDTTKILSENLRIISTIFDSEEKCETRRFDYAKAADDLKSQSVPMMDIEDFLQFCQTVDQQYRRSKGNNGGNMNQLCYTIHAMFKDVQSQQLMKQRAQYLRNTNVSMLFGNKMIMMNTTDDDSNSNNYRNGDLLFINEDNINDTRELGLAYYLGWIEVGYCMEGPKLKQKEIDFTSNINDTLFRNIWNYGASVRIAKRVGSEICLDKSVTTKPFSWPIENLKRGFDMSAPLSIIDEYDSLTQSYSFLQPRRVASTFNHRKYRWPKQVFRDKESLYIGDYRWMRQHLTAGFNLSKSYSGNRQSNNYRFYLEDNRYAGMTFVQGRCGFEYKSGGDTDWDNYVRVFYGILLNPQSVRDYLMKINMNSDDKWSYFSVENQKYGSKPKNGRKSEKKQHLRIIAGFVDCKGYSPIRNRFQNIRPLEKIFCMPLWILVCVGMSSSMIIGWFSLKNMRYIAIDIYSEHIKNNIHGNAMTHDDQIHRDIKDGVQRYVESEISNAIMDGINDYLTKIVSQQLLSESDDDGNAKGYNSGGHITNNNHIMNYYFFPVEMAKVVAQYSVELDDTETVPLMRRTLRNQIMWAWMFHYGLIALRVTLIILSSIAIIIEYTRYNLKTRDNSSFFFAGYHGIWWAFLFHPLLAKSPFYLYGLQGECLGKGKHTQPEFLIWFELYDLANKETECSCFDVWNLILVFTMGLYTWVWMGLLVAVTLATGLSVFLIPYGLFFGTLYLWSLCYPSLFVQPRTTDPWDCDCCCLTVNSVHLNINRFVFESHDEFMLGLNKLRHRRIKQRRNDAEVQMAPLMSSEEYTLDVRIPEEGVEMVISSGLAGSDSYTSGGSEMIMREKGEMKTPYRMSDDFGEVVHSVDVSEEKREEDGNKRAEQLSEEDDFSLMDESELYAKRSCQDHLWQCVPFVCSLEESFNEEEHSRADLYRRHVLRKYIVHSLIIVAISTLAWFFYTPMSVASAVFLSQEEDWLGAVKYGFDWRQCKNESVIRFDASSWVAWTLLLSWFIV